MKKILLPLIPALLLGAANAAPKISAQSIIVNPVQSSLNVRVWTDRDPTAQQTPTYRAGERIRLYVTPSQDAYIYLFNVNPNGSIDQILPNRYESGAAFVKANTVKAFPGTGDQFTFDIAGPNGVNKVLALASRTQLDLSQLSSFKSGQDRFATVNVQGQDRFAQALSIVVNPVKSDAWVTATAQYNVSGAVQTPAPVRPNPVVRPPAWNSSNNWSYRYTSNQDTLQGVYQRYNRELQDQGYRLVELRERGNKIEANYRKGNSTANLEVKQEGRSGKFEVKITRRN